MAKNIPPRSEMTPEELARARAQDKRKRRLRGYGQGLHTTPAELAAAAAVVRGCHDQGMPYWLMEEQLGVSRHVLGRLLSGRKKALKRENYEAIIALEFRPPPEGPRTGSKVNSLGSIRRVDALRSLGFPKDILADYLGVAHQNMPTGVEHRPMIFPDMERKIREMYDKLSLADPLDFAPAHAVARALSRAEKLGLAGPLCWDDDTIDDPDGFPQWTGECGTVRGYYLHLKYGIRVKRYSESAKTPDSKQRQEVLCVPCTDARRVQGGGGSWVDEEAIRARVAEGVYTYRDIAKEYTCSSMTVQRIVNKMKAEGWTPRKCGARPKEQR